MLTGRPLNLGQVVRSVQSMSQHFIRSHADKSGGDLGSAIESTLWVVWKHAEFFNRCGEDSLDVLGHGVDSSTIGREMRLLFTDEVFIQLLDVDKLVAPPGGAAAAGGSGGFISTIVRRLKRIVAPAL